MLQRQKSNAMDMRAMEKGILLTYKRKKQKTIVKQETNCSIMLRVCRARDIVQTEAETMLNACLWTDVGICDMEEHGRDRGNESTVRGCSAIATIRLGVLGVNCLVLKHESRVALTEDLHVELQQLTASAKIWSSNESIDNGAQLAFVEKSIDAVCTAEFGHGGR
jgi:hypothetical protein